MTRVVLLSLAAAGLIYAAYASLAESEPEVTTSPANGSEAEIRETPWTGVQGALLMGPLTSDSHVIDNAGEEFRSYLGYAASNGLYRSTRGTSSPRH